jgi:N-acetylmuramoyl-L-alanine amidase
LRELDINWEVAIILDSLLRLEKNINVVLTKQYREQKVTNFKRALIANKNNSNIFIRLHCDTGAGSGYTIYYPDRKGCKNGYCGPSYDIIKESRIAAMIIFDSLKTLLSNALNSNGVKGDSRTFIGAKQGALTGSIFSKVSVVLVEMVFLSNKKDVLFINGYAQKLKIAKALKSGIMDYLHRRG